MSNLLGRVKYLATLCMGIFVGIVIATSVSSIQAADAKPAYMLVSGTVTDAAGLAAYGEKAGPLAQAAGLNILARGQVTVFEGEWPHPKVVTIERFDSMAALNDFWYSEGYQEAIKLREGKFQADFIVAVEGM